MRLIGKCPPKLDSLTAAADRGFNAVELYLTPEHIDSFEETLETVREAPVDIASIHTPHVIPDESFYFTKTDELAQAVDATLVVHSQYLHHTHIEELEAMHFDARYGYENIPGASKFHLENAILERGFKLILDTAHLYIAEQEYQAAFEFLLKQYDSAIPLIHLNDATAVQDGLPFGEGEIDLEETVTILDNYYSGTVVLEVMPEYQTDALTQTKAWMG